MGHLKKEVAPLKIWHDPWKWRHDFLQAYDTRSFQFYSNLPLYLRNVLTPLLRQLPTPQQQHNPTWSKRVQNTHHLKIDIADGFDFHLLVLKSTNKDIDTLFLALTYV
jgi:hypothetical protein